jgi:C-terminal processing protease CtpA/Prc
MREERHRGAPPAPRARRLALALVAAAGLLLAARAGAAQSPITSFDSAWAAVSRTYWDTALVNGRWRAASDSLRRGLGEAPDDAAVRAAIRALIAVPAQSHFVLIPRAVAPPPDDAGSSGGGDAPAARHGTTGLDLRMIGDTLVVWRVLPRSPADSAGLRVGAIVTRLDTIEVDSARALLLGADPGDTTRARRVLNSLALGRLGGPAGDTVRITARLTPGPPGCSRSCARPCRGNSPDWATCRRWSCGAPATRWRSATAASRR